MSPIPSSGSNSSSSISSSSSSNSVSDQTLAGSVAMGNGTTGPTRAMPAATPTPPTAESGFAEKSRQAGSSLEEVCARFRMRRVRERE
jgi:hypothetical protein